MKSRTDRAADLILGALFALGAGMYLVAFLAAVFL